MAHLGSRLGKAKAMHGNIIKILNLYIFFNVLSCITSFQYLSITCNAFIACYSITVNFEEVCPVYKGMLDPIIIIYKLTSCQLLYLTNTYKHGLIELNRDLSPCERSK